MKIRRTSSEYIPIEIQEEILKRLPVKSLARFRCVSKQWNRLIDNRDFVVSYGVLHPQSRRFLHKKKKENKYFTSFEDHKEFGSEDPCVVPDLLSRHEGNFVGSSHGLLCFYIIYHESTNDSSENLSKEVVVVWNPSIRKSVCIPPPNIYLDLPHDDGYGVFTAFGFGVCPVTFDPIILKMKWMDRHSSFSRRWRVAVFTLSTGAWSILSTNLPRNSIRLRGSQVLIDRFIYWLAFEKFERRHGRDRLHFLIMSFDLTAKEFKEIKLTAGSLTHQRCSIESISKLGESLVLLGYHREFKGDPSVCCLWMMTKEGGVNTSFSKLYNINVSHTKVKALLGFRKTGELILVTQKKEYKAAKFKIYDPNSEAIVNLGRNYSFFMCSYMESLLLLDQSDGFTYPIRIIHI